MNRPWMPLYVAEFVADTQHLDAAQTGAYMMLLGHYWQTGGKLPHDDPSLARISRMTMAQWRKARPLLEPFFQEGWKHKRVEFELTEASRISAAGRKGGEASARSRRNRSNDQATIVQRNSNDLPDDPSTNPQALHLQRKKDAADAAPDPETELFARGKEVLGKDAGGLITKLLKAKNKNVVLARAVIDTASQKQDPREYVSAVIRGPKNGEFKLMSGREGVI